MPTYNATQPPQGKPLLEMLSNAEPIPLSHYRLFLPIPGCEAASSAITGQSTFFIHPAPKQFPKFRGIFFRWNSLPHKSG